MRKHGRSWQGKVLATSIGLGVASVSATASAFDFALKIEPGFAVSVDDTQEKAFKYGGSMGLKALFGVTSFLDVQIGGTFIGFHPRIDGRDPSTIWATTGGLRLKRPMTRKHHGGIMPWVDTDLLYVRIDDRDRFGFDVGAGIAFAPGRNRKVAFGPFVRYVQVVERDKAGLEFPDEKMIIAGLSLEANLIDKHSWRTTTTTTTTNVERDRDGDGVMDVNDRCPDVPGPADNMGCPVYAQVTVSETELIPHEVIHFATDQATIEPVSYPMLDAIVDVMKQNPSFHLRINGNADSTGTEEHNLRLGEARAVEVMQYLVAHGVPRERVAPRTFGEDKPVETNATVDGRQANRRVEFHVFRTEQP